VATDYLKTLQTTPDDAARAYRLATVLDMLVRAQLSERKPADTRLLKLACDLYQKAPKDRSEATLRLVSLLAAAGETIAAMEHLERVRPMFKDDATALAMAAVSVVREGSATPQQFDTVAGWVEAGLAKQPNNAELLLTKAELQTIKQDFAGAEATYRKVLAVDKQNIVALNNLAWMLAGANDPNKVKEGMECIQKAIFQRGTRGELLDTRAKLFMTGGQIDRAVDDLTDALTEAPTAQRYFHLALAYSKQGKSQDSAEAFRKARSKGLDARRVHPLELAEFKDMLRKNEG
jgi:tetratricopeptide (TPR) repeat protein